MQLNKPSKIILGILTFLPLIVGASLVVFGFLQLFSFIFSEDPIMPMMFLSYLGYIVPYLFFFFLIYLGMGIFYLVHIVRNKSLDSEKKFLWMVVLFVLNTFSMPVYWYMHVWRNKPTDFESDPVFDTYESGTQSEKL